MKEYCFNKWAKIITVVLTIIAAALLSESLLFTGGVLERLSTLALLLVFIHLTVNAMVYKIVADDDFIKERSLFKTKKIFFGEILQTEIRNDFIEINTGTKKIRISKILIDNSQELIDTILSPIVNDSRVLLYGDPPVIKSYSEQFSGSPSLNTRKFQQSIDR